MIPFEAPNKCLSESQEDYLKQIYFLTERGASAGTQALAEKLHVAPASVTVMLQRLGDMNLVNYEQYKGVRLTPTGTAAALEIVRHHRLLESFLCQALGYGWDEVHEEAEKLEHYISETLEARMAAWLGDPSRDPHGDPIPDGNLHLPDDRHQGTLAEQRPGFRGQLVRVGTQDADELHLFSQLGLIPGAAVEVTGQTDDSVRLKTPLGPYLLPLSLGRLLSVQPGDSQ